MQSWSYTEATRSRAVSYRSFLEGQGPVTLLPYRRAIIGMGRFAIAIAIVGVLPMQHAMRAGEPLIGFMLALPVTLCGGIMLLQGARIERIVLGEAGIAMLPGGPFIPAGEIVAIEEVPGPSPPFARLRRRAFRIVLAQPRLIPLIAPVGALGRTLGITGADATLRQEASPDARTRTDALRARRAGPARAADVTRPDRGSLRAGVG